MYTFVTGELTTSLAYYYLVWNCVVALSLVVSLSMFSWPDFYILYILYSKGFSSGAYNE